MVFPSRDASLNAGELRLSLQEASQRSASIAHSSLPPVLHLEHRQNLIYSQCSVATSSSAKTFEKYEVSLDGSASDGDVLICWGRVRMTLMGNWLGVVPNGKRAELPVFILFSFKDDLIAGERFSFDLSELCAQSGVSTDAVRHRFFGRGQQAALTVL